MAEKPKGLPYLSQLVGKHQFRVRETHVRDHLAPLLTKGRAGAVKLDLILRGVALNPVHKGKRKTPGQVLDTYAYPELHDLARGNAWYTGQPEDNELLDQAMLKAKRKWVGDQLRELENLRLLKREDRPGRHPRITVLRDDGSGRPFDDPDGSPNNTYITILGGIIASGALAEWTTAQLAFYLFAMVAERHDRRYRPGETEPGSGSWFRPLTWISDPTQRHRGAVLIPFKEATLERGRAAFENEGLITVVKSRYDPVTRQRFQSGTRNLYTNRFDTLTQAAKILPAEQFDAELMRLSEQAASSS
jgi:hypothetical protein